MDPMAARAIGGARRAILHGEAMIAFKERLHAVGGQAVFGVDPLRGVALTAHLLRTARGAAFQPLDLVFGMAVGACRRVTGAFGGGLAVNTGLKIRRRLGVTLAASHGQLGIMQRRGWEVGCKYIMGAMAI